MPISRDFSTTFNQYPYGDRTFWLDMKNHDLKISIDRHARHLLDGNFDMLVRYYDRVIPIFRGKDLIIINGHAELRRFFGRFRAEILASGIEKITGEIIKAACNAEGRFQNTIKWHYSDSDGQSLGTAKVLYYGTHSPGLSVIEMARYLETSDRVSAVWRDFRADKPIKSPAPSIKVVH